MLRYLTAGESHGQGLAVILEGLPAGLAISREDIESELKRRWLGYGRGPRQRVETDVLTLQAGLRFGKTLGSPLSLLIANAEWEEKWQVEMNPETGATEKPLTAPRPGHVDLAGMQKYGTDDARNLLERASARETAARVAAGACAKVFLRTIGIEIISHVVQLGSVKANPDLLPTPADLQAIDDSEVRVFDPDAREKMIAEIKAAAKEGDSLGGAAEVIAYNVPVGLGSHIQWDRRLDAQLAQALMSIQAIKAVEIGEGIDVAGRLGSVAHDPIYWNAENENYERRSSLAGGIEGGISVGGLVRARAYMKPLSTLNRPVLETVDIKSKESTVSFKERTDCTAVPAMGVVAETMVALTLANAAIEKFGGDSVDEFVRNVESYNKNLSEYV